MTLTNADWAAVAEDLLAPAEAEKALAPVFQQAPPRYNVAPTQAHPVVVKGEGIPQIVLATWGFPGKDGGPLVINARAETVPAKPMFRDALASGRCIVVADGFLEWRKTPVGRQPLWFRRKDKGPLYFAGLVRPARDAAAMPRFVVLTTSPNHLVAPVHDRMPAVLTAEAARAWLQAPTLDVLRPAADAYLTATPVSPRVNNANHDDPECLLPQDVTRTQLSLF